MAMDRPGAPDAFGNFPAKQRAGSAWPATPRDRGNWEVGQSYQAGDVVDYNATRTGQQWLCLGAHVASAESNPAMSGAFWEPYAGEPQG